MNLVEEIHDDKHKALERLRELLLESEEKHDLWKTEVNEMPLPELLEDSSVVVADDLGSPAGIDKIIDMLKEHEEVDQWVNSGDIPPGQILLETDKWSVWIEEWERTDGEGVYIATLSISEL